MPEGHRNDSSSLGITSPDTRSPDLAPSAEIGSVYKFDVERVVNTVSRVGRTVLFWRLSATKPILLVLAGAVACALLYAGGTASLAGIIKWLAEPSATLAWTNALMMTAFVARPFFFANHIKMVTWAAALALDDLEKEQSSEVLSRGFVKQTVSATIILTRDLPALVVLSGTMAWQGGLIGSVVAGLVLAGLAAAGPAQRFAYFRHSAKVSKRINRSHADALGRRNSRAWSEASSDIVLMLLVLVLVLFKASDVGLVTDSLTSVVVLALLLASPLRRMARLIGFGQAVGNAEDDVD
jgi:hypothetical protein